MKMNIDENTRVVSNTDRKEFLDTKYKRDIIKRIERLERIVEDQAKEISALKGSKEN